MDHFSGGTPDYAIEEAAGAGAERIIVVISAAKTAIRTYLGKTAGMSDMTLPLKSISRRAMGPDVVYVFQDQPLGLGHAVLCCKDEALPGPVAVLLPDDLITGGNCLADMAERHSGGHMIAAM